MASLGSREGSECEAGSPLRAEDKDLRDTQSLQWGRKRGNRTRKKQHKTKPPISDFLSPQYRDH